MFRPNHGKRLVTHNPAAGNAKDPEIGRKIAQSVFGQDGISEAGFDDAPDGGGVVGLHDDAWLLAYFNEEGVDDGTHITTLRIEQEGRIVQQSRIDVADPETVAGLLRPGVSRLRDWRRIRIRYRASGEPPPGRVPRAEAPRAWAQDVCLAGQKGQCAVHRQDYAAAC